VVGPLWGLIWDGAGVAVFLNLVGLFAIACHLQNLCVAIAGVWPLRSE
jgi:hypothetical protein